MTILIHTIPSDVHAAAVQIALKSKDIPSQTWFMGDYPSHQVSTFRYKFGGGSNFLIRDRFDTLCSSTKFSTVWHRRIPEFQSASPEVEEIDKVFVKNEISRFLSTSYPLVGVDAFWVNDATKSQHCENKLIQLDAALKVGLKIPETLASNSPDDIRDFLKFLLPRKIIYKPLRGFSWIYKDRQLITYTKILNETDLPSDSLLQVCPGIYQEYIEKDFEVRVTIMGRHCVAAALYAPDKEDWRMSSEKNELIAIAHSLPSEIEEMCIAMMKNLGIVFGCADFVVTPNGDYIFLEINEAGQFMWVEQMIPELLLIDSFSEFLVERNPDFRWKKNSSAITLKEIIQNKEFNNLMNMADRHVHARNPTIL
jgi:glutathione synthase/RimK-type ligase-like ATP-grasp enzyme